MPGNGKRQKKKEPPLKEKKGMSGAEVRAVDRASGQQGLASAAAIHAVYGHSTVTNRRTKAKIQQEFEARNKLELDADKARHNYQIYRKYTQDHALRRESRLECFGRGRALSRGHMYFSDSRNKLALHKRGQNNEVPTHSADGDSTDYDTEADTGLQMMLAEMPPLSTLPLAPSLPQPPTTDSRAGQQPPLPPPTTSGAGKGLGRKAICTPPASDAEQAGCTKQLVLPSVQSVLDTHADWQRQAEEKKVQQAGEKKRAEEQKQKKKKRQLVMEEECPLTAPPGMAPPKPSAGTCSEEQIQVIQEVLDETAGSVPPGVVHPPRISLLLELISPIPTLPPSPMPNPLIPDKELPVQIMEQEEAGPEKQAHVEEVEMAEAEPTAEAAAAAAPAAGAEVMAAAVPAAGADAVAAIEVSPHHRIG